MRISPEQIDRLAGQIPGMGRDPASVRVRVEAMEHLLEGLFVVPGTRYRIGMDALVGLIPVVGDVVTAAMGAWIVWEARNIGLSKFQIARMIGNIGFDTLIGAVPIVGDLFDAAFKSNTRNLAIIRRHLDRHHPGTSTIEGKRA